MLNRWFFKPGKPNPLCPVLHVTDPKGRQVAVCGTSSQALTVGLQAIPLTAYKAFEGQIRRQVEGHFQALFAFEHEAYSGTGPTPRQRYGEYLSSWSTDEEGRIAF